MTNRTVAAVIYDRLATFEMAIAVEIFGLPRPELKRLRWYDFKVCSLDAGPARATGGIRVTASRGLQALRDAGTIVIPGWRNPAEVPPERFLRALRTAHVRGARIVSICSGTFVLAAAGLLDGKRATTHWMYVDALRRMYPRIRVEPDVLYVDEGSVLTSAGGAAGIDLCLHLVRRDFGAEVANQVARRLVVPPHRDGGQAQYVRAALPAERSIGLAPVLDWAVERLHTTLTVARLARRANQSPRTFARRFVAETGTTPHRWLTQQRLVAAQRRLETSTDSVDEVAQAVGFESAGALRHHFRRAFGVTPTAYRHRFAERPSSVSRSTQPRTSLRRRRGKPQ